MYREWMHRPASALSFSFSVGTFAAISGVDIVSTIAAHKTVRVSIMGGSFLGEDQPRLITQCKEWLNGPPTRLQAAPGVRVVPAPRLKPGLTHLGRSRPRWL